MNIKQKMNYSTVPLPDGIVIGGEWPNTIISWPGGKSRGATKPEYDLFQALEQSHTAIAKLRRALVELVGASTKQELEEMEFGLRLTPGVESDKIAALNAVHALQDTL